MKKLIKINKNNIFLLNFFLIFLLEKINKFLYKPKFLKFKKNLIKNHLLLTQLNLAKIKTSTRYTDLTKS